jgi:HD-GYP domain-containing protein (c-di-GMP phosphodiesterase class II)
MIAGAAIELALGLGLPDSEIERIRVASLLHDLGKLAIPEEILTKPGELNDPEWRIVSEHPKIGQVILEQAGALRDAATIVLHHHEWYDGRGYPHGLAGEEIPVGARIVAIADAYEAMVAGRPYRAAVTHEEALRELRRHGGMQFDPLLVEAFAELFAERMPFEIDRAPHGHAHPHADAQDGRTNAEIHDALHARRRKVVPSARAVEAEATGTNG